MPQDNDSKPAASHVNSPFDKEVGIDCQESSVNRAGSLEIGGVFYLASNHCFEAHTVFIAIESAINSHWWNELSERSKDNYRHVLKNFLPWLARKEVTKEDRFKLLKRYETHRVKTIKNDSSGLRQVLTLLTRSLENGVFEQKEIKYLVALTRYTKPLPSQDANAYTLARHFSSTPWLKPILKDDWYLIESPKRLIQSFIIAVSETLTFVMEQRVKTEYFEFENLNRRTNKEYQGNNYWILYCKRLLLDSIKNKDQELLDVMVNDFISPFKGKRIVELIRIGRSIDEPLSKDLNEVFGRKCFLKPNIFSPYDASGPSLLEQTLFSWLCAAQTVAPASIPELTARQFAIERNLRGDISFMQCVYNKTRSSSEKSETKLLTAGDPELASMSAYIAQYGRGSKHLCPDIKRTIPYNKHSFGNLVSRMLRLWKMPNLRSEIERKHAAASCQPVFVKTMEAINAHSGQAHSSWIAERRLSCESLGFTDYQEQVQNSLPITLFALSHIKTTAVHATSDNYREGDLVNYNSHTSETEKHSYLTDSNKDWVNQHGRITRLVMREVERAVTEMDFNAAINLVRKKSECSIVDDVSEGDELKESSIFGSFTNIDFDLVVIDSPETVVNFLHYIDQAKKKIRKLITINKEFVEAVVLPTVEWMHFLLQQRLSPSVVSQGRKEYQNIKKILPNIFESNLILTT